MHRHYPSRIDPLYEFALSVKAIQRELERQTNAAMEPLGLTGAQADALMVIGQAGPLSLKDLGAMLIAEAGHPSRLVDRLVEAGLVERRPADDDRRRIVLTLTPRGRKLNERAGEVRESIFELAGQLVGGRDLEPVLETLREFVGYTSYAELVERRRELLTRPTGGSP
jgi:DNA-binding MarR family transcriptional regulator